MLLCLLLCAEAGAATQRGRGRRQPEPAEAPAPPEQAPEKKEEEPGKKARYFALLGGEVHSVSGPVLEQADILAKDGVILRIGRDLILPEDCEKLDVHGCRVYPGLVASDASGILGRSPPDNSTDLFGLNMILALSSGITTVVSDNVAAKLTFGTTEDMVLSRSVFTRLRYSRGAPASRAELRDDLDKVRGYLRELAAYEVKKAAGDTEAKEPDGKWLKGKYESYLKLLKGESPALLAASRVQDLRDACDLAVEYGFRVVLDGAEEAWILPGELGRAGAQVLLTPRSKRYPDEDRSAPSGSSIETARILHEHGVSFAILPENRGINSLGGITGRDLLGLALEAGFAVRGGLPEDAAVRAITLDAARLIGLDDRVGSIEEGKDADLIVCDGDLLHYNTLVQWTIVNGRVVYDKEKESLFSHIRPREGGSTDTQSFWPRPFGEMGEM